MQRGRSARVALGAAWVLLVCVQPASARPSPPAHRPALPSPEAPRAQLSVDQQLTHLALSIAAPDVDPEVLELALISSSTARRFGFGRRKPFLTVIDYARPTSERRLWVFDLRTRQLIFREHVAHGRGTGTEHAERWSNREGSQASSVGLFVTREVFRGRRGLSLRLIGLEPGFNDRAFERGIVMHGAPYMGERYRSDHGSFGQSHGCPALDHKVARKVIDVISGGSLLFIHMKDPGWREHSEWLAGRRPRLLRAQPYGRTREGPPSASE